MNMERKTEMNIKTIKIYGKTYELVESDFGEQCQRCAFLSKKICPGKCGTKGFYVEK